MHLLGVDIFPCLADVAAWGRGFIWSMLAFLSQRTDLAKVFRASAHVTFPDVTLLLSSMKLSFFSIMAEIHRLSLINRTRGISLDVISICLRVKLSVQS